MDVIRFRVWMDNHPEVTRTLEVRTDQTFDILHQFILRSVDFDNTQLASFYVCNDDWEKKVEITLIDMSADDGDLVPVMSETPLGAYIEEEGQKLIYEYDFVLMWRFLLEVERIEEDVRQTAAYPILVASEGEAPLQYAAEDPYEQDVTEEDEAIISHLRQKNQELLLIVDDEEEDLNGEPDIFDDFDDFDSFGSGSRSRRSEDDDY